MYYYATVKWLNLNCDKCKIIPDQSAVFRYFGQTFAFWDSINTNSKIDKSKKCLSNHDDPRLNKVIFIGRYIHVLNIISDIIF